MHDFIDSGMGKAIPYRVYDIGTDEGSVSVGDNADTAAFAVNAIRRWWERLGRQRFPEATRLLITADGGGSNGYRLRAFKVELAHLASETGLEITVCHFPPGTSKWNKIVIYTEFPGVPDRGPRRPYSDPELGLLGDR